MGSESIDLHSWVDLKSTTMKDFDNILENIKINRYATGGVISSNKGIKEIVGDLSFWDKLVWGCCGSDKPAWRLGCVNEACDPDKELHAKHLVELKETNNE